MLYVPGKNFTGRSGLFPGLNQYQEMKIECLAQGHIAPLVRFEPATLPSDTLPTKQMVLPVDEYIFHNFIVIETE